MPIRKPGTSKGSSPQTIAISPGRTPEDHVTHTITEPTRLWLEQTALGANAALEIESVDDVKTFSVVSHAPCSVEIVRKKQTKKSR